MWKGVELIGPAPLAGLVGSILLVQDQGMKKGDIICPNCSAGFRRMELSSLQDSEGEYRGPICSELLEHFDGSKRIEYRLMVMPIEVRSRDFLE
jgi:hypothetical protein